MADLLAVSRRAAEAVAAAFMGLMFATFILQVAIRYGVRVEGLVDAVPLLDPALYGWTLEFCLALWVWLIFWGNAFVVRDRDHVSFDILALKVGPRVRRVFVIVGGLAVVVGLTLSIGPTWDRFAILRLKQTATLADLFGDWIRMRDIYIIYMLFLVAVTGRYLWVVWQAFRHGVPEPDLGIDGDRGERR
ncbi:TRAP transporter small permease [Limimaricola litoreus]|uniref:TRAP transporter small permease protein n=1 Tax=Limimaricola litoreus TaxID=2955316 RepID=A0A9X2G0S4_9RHOB|nr:TRAP transporter small permease subunit [Limimaricola litoreus]MCP1170658.1 TRAP transporter small permease [Limimaricola litoreus]